ncbi:Aste57867_327 [Aphanomyces stellatus]|uniref:Aste57867_327 protein n=1 Tax=Aphanomyces stellatus TaxID=120398 RepID=A0A485K2R5_9STRA|nr:hypothetical protein As57867_000327 [Aphanomyces stellatus]VFT77553.1 Aste57867_327 [Aphanomyces stellatus]
MEIGGSIASQTSMSAPRRKIAKAIAELLETQSNETLEEIASYQKLAWRSVTVLSVDAKTAVEPRTLDIMSTAFLCDLRVVLTMVEHAGGLNQRKPRPMEFEFLRHKDASVGIAPSDERSTPVDDILQKGQTVYVRYRPASKTPTRSSRRGHSFTDKSKPTFAITSVFSGFELSADIFVRPSGLVINLKDIVDEKSQIAVATLNDENALVVVELTHVQVGDIAGLTEDTLTIMMSIAQNQKTILQKVLARMVLTLDQSTSKLGVQFSDDVVQAAQVTIHKVPSLRKTPSIESSPAKTKRQSSVVLPAVEEKPVTKLPHEPADDKWRRPLMPPSATVEPIIEPIKPEVDNSARSTKVDSLPASTSAVVPQTLASDFDRAFLVALEFMTQDDSTPPMHSLMAADELVLSYGMSHAGVVSKASKYIVHVREAFKKILMHCVHNGETKKIARYLWRGVGHCVWHELRDEMFCRFRLDMLARLREFQKKMINHEPFVGFKDMRESMSSSSWNMYESYVVGYSEEVALVVRCLKLCLEPHDVAAIVATSVWDHIQALGLRDFKSFRKTTTRFDSFCRNRAFPPRVRAVLLEWMVLPAFTSMADRKDEAHFNVTFLRDLVGIVVETTNVEFIQIKKMHECFAQALATKVSTGAYGYVGDVVRTCQKWLEQTAATAFAPCVKSIDEIRCAQIEAIACILANQSGTFSCRWYIPPFVCTKQERYFFVGEHDLAFEFMFVSTHDSPLPVVYNAMGEPMLTSESLERLLLDALTKWFRPSPIMAAERGCATFGLNFGLFAALDSLGHGWGLEDVLKAANVDKVGIGSGVSVDGKKSLVVMRLYGVSWHRVSYTVKEPMHFLLWLKYLQINELDVAVRHGALYICELLLCKESHKSILASTAKSSGTIPLGLAAEVYELIVMSWSEPPLAMLSDATNLSWNFPFVMSMIQQNKIYAHFTVKILETLCTLLTTPTKSKYVVALLSQRSLYDAQNEDLVDVVADLTYHPELPLRVLDLAQKVLLECLLHAQIGTSSRIVRLFPRISDAQLGFRISPKPSPYGDITISQAKCSYLLNFDILSKLSGAIKSIVDSANVLSMETLQLRYLCILATPAGGLWLSRNVRYVSLIVGCIQPSATPLLCMQAGKALQTLSNVFSNGKCGFLPDAHSRKMLVDAIGGCVLFSSPTMGNEVGMYAISALANLLSATPWNQLCLETLKALFDRPPNPPWSSYLLCAVQPTRLDRACETFIQQHRNTKPCQCKVVLRDSSKLSIIKKTAVRFVATIFRSIFQHSRPSTAEYTKRITAKKIQRSILKWMYVKRISKGFLPVVLKYSKCAMCSPAPSCLATLILLACGYDIDPQTRQARELNLPPEFQLAAFQLLGQFWYHSEFVAIACNELRVMFTYLVFSSHENPDIRHESLRSLCHLTWCYPSVVNYISPTIVKSLWGKSYFRNSDIGGTWIDNIIQKSLDSHRKDIASHIDDIKYTLEYFAILALDPRITGLLTRCLGFVWKLLQTWCTKKCFDELDETLFIALILVQNVLLTIPLGDNFKFELPVNDFVAVLSKKNVRIKVGLCGLLWALALREDGRLSIQSSKDCSQLLAALSSVVFQSYLGSISTDLLMLIYNGLGALATLALDPKISKELLQAKVNEPASLLAIWARSKATKPDTPSNFECGFYVSLESLLISEDVPDNLRRTIHHLKQMAGYGVAPDLGSRAVQISLLMDKIHLQSVRLLGSLLIHDSKLSVEWQNWLSSFSSTHNSSLLMYMCAALFILVRTEKSRSAVVPQSVLDYLRAMITDGKLQNLQVLAVQALGYLSVQSTSAKKLVRELELIKQLSHFKVELQIEFLHMIALSTKNTGRSAILLNDSDMVTILVRVLQSRDVFKVWDQNPTTWSPIFLDDKEQSVHYETSVVKYIRRPVELVQLCSIGMESLPKSHNVPKLFLELLKEVMFHTPNLVKYVLRDAQELTLELSQTLRNWTLNNGLFQLQCSSAELVTGTDL